MDKTRYSTGRIAGLLCTGLMAAFGSQPAPAAEIHVKMMDISDSGQLAFEPGFVKAQAGDTIVFEPTQKGGHSTYSLLVPPGAKAWSGAADKETRVRLETEGVYLYACTAHKRMGMVGVIQVGQPINLEQAKKAAASESSGFVFNKDRFDKELAQVR